MITINELTPLTNITRKQINNRLIPLVNRYPNLIKGGGRGKRGKYSIHPLLIKYLTHYKPYTSLEDIKVWDEIQSDYLKTFTPINTLETFKKVEWKFFCCYSPASNLDSHVLINLISLEVGDMVFYSIHTDEKEKNHIHFVTTHCDEKRLKNYDKVMDIPEVVPFISLELEGCYNYFTNLQLYRGKQRVTEYGYIIGLKDRKGIKKVIL
jgi:hypothetical protein